MPMPTKLNSIKIGNIKIDTPVILAPMSGVTDLPYRKLVKKFGAGLVVSEMIASRAMIAKSHQSMKKCGITHDDYTGACVQLAGCEPQVIADAAKMNEDMGAKIIDINFGCPAKKVVGGFAGSALMRDIKLASRILETTVKAVNLPVTVKMRLGWDDQSKCAPDLAKIAEEVGIQMITVHGRTRCQFYSGSADWKFIKKIKESVKIPVVANGDIVCFDSAVKAKEDSKADGLMIGRGCYGKPWLISQIIYFMQTGKKIPAPSLAIQKATILDHYNAIMDYYGDEVGVKIARKHLGWYSAGFANSSKFRASINTMNKSCAVLDKIHEFYDAQSIIMSK